MSAQEQSGATSVAADPSLPPTRFPKPGQVRISSKDGTPFTIELHDHTGSILTRGIAGIHIAPITANSGPIQATIELAWVPLDIIAKDWGVDIAEAIRRHVQRRQQDAIDMLEQLRVLNASRANDGTANAQHQAECKVRAAFAGVIQQKLRELWEMPL